jgi:hypothetical protein
MDTLLKSHLAHSLTSSFQRGLRIWGIDRYHISGLIKLRSKGRFMKLVFVFLMTTLMVLSGCSGRAPQVSTEPQPTSSPEAETPPPPTVDSEPPEEPATASQVILEYWEAMNSYDLELALSYYEEQYREQEEEEVKDDISRLRQFSVTLSVNSVSEPIYMSEDRVRYDIMLGTPVGERALTYPLQRINGEWKIYLEDNTDDFPEAEEFIIDFLTEYGESQRMDIIINAEQQIDIERPTAEYALDELIKSGEIIEVRPDVFSLPSQQ